MSIIKVIGLSKFSVKIPNSTQNKPCVILGNGPSLSESMANHHNFLNKAELFCVNMFANTSQYQELKPENYLLLDEAFIDPNHTLASNALKQIANNTSWKINLYVPSKMSNSAYFKDIISKNESIKVIPFNYTIVSGFEGLTHWLFEHNLGMPQCQNVLVATLFMTINSGFKEIYLIGADHSWHEMIKLDEQNSLFMEDNHFYGSRKTSLKASQISFLSRQFLSLHKAFYGYEVLAKYAQSKRVKVLNASTKSYIDVFDKISLP